MKIIADILSGIGLRGVVVGKYLVHGYKSVITFISQLGETSILLAKTAKRLPNISRDAGEVVHQMYTIGVSSLPLVLGISIFTGAITTWQAKYQFSNLVPMRYLGTAACKSIIMELGPVLTSLVIAARVGASLAAEIGTMKTTEQIDAMECLAMDPIRFLIMPRMVAGFVMLPVMVIIADFIALIGAWFVAVLFMNVTSHMFTSGLKIFFNVKDIYIGLTKSAVFGVIIAVMGCYHGLKSSGGAHGVGQATMKAVVSSSVLILIFDYIVASVMF